MRPTFNDALCIAIKAHDRQYDKDGQPYILHSIGVSEMVFYWDEKIVAILHDVVGNSDYTLNEISKLLHSIVNNSNYEYEWQRKIFYDKEIYETEKIIKAIDYISKRGEETYDDYISRLSENKLALIVKIADMKYNSDITRISEYNRDKFLPFMEKYNKYLPILEGNVRRYEKSPEHCCKYQSLDIV